MGEGITRRTFVAAAGGCVVAPLSQRAGAQSLPESEGSSDVLPAGFPSHDPSLAREVVGKSHFDYDTVKKLVEARPALAKVSWDWGFGDWESALGAASHVGRREIADLLIAHGARPDIFTFA